MPRVDRAVEIFGRIIRQPYLIHEHRRRHIAEVSSRNSMAELAYIKSQGHSGGIVSVHRS